MNRDEQTKEARLERSLRGQVRAPRLDGRFDAAVWSRIAAEERKAAPPIRRSAMPKWLVACNVLGVAVTVLLVVVYAVQAAGMLQSSASDAAASLPGFDLPDTASLLQYASPIITTVALGFGLLFTRVGQRLISALR